MQNWIITASINWRAKRNCHNTAQIFVTSSGRNFAQSRKQTRNTYRKGIQYTSKEQRYGLQNSHPYNLRKVRKTDFSSVLTGCDSACKQATLASSLKPIHIHFLSYTIYCIPALYAVMFHISYSSELSVYL